MALEYGGTVLLMHMDGTTGAQPTLDSSPSPKFANPNGNVIVSTAQSKFGGQSAYFDGSGDWLNLSTHPDWDFLKGDFTIEFWVYFEDLSVTNISPHLVSLGYDVSNRLAIWWDGGTCKVNTNVEGVGATRILSSQPSSTGVWEHWALVKSGVTTALYKDGTVVGSVDNMPVPNYRSDTTLALGYLQYSGQTKHYFKGYLDEVRIVKLMAVYTAPFTPPSVALDVIPGPRPTVDITTGGYVLARGSADHNPTPAFRGKATDTRDRAPYGLATSRNELLGDGVRHPWQFKGRGRIAGTVKEKASPNDKPVARRVRLYREPDGLLVRTVWSDPVTGAYEFYGIPMDARYTVVSHDYNALYRAVLADNLAPELIP